MADQVVEFQEELDNRGVVAGIVDSLKQTPLTLIEITEGLREVVVNSDDPGKDFRVASGLLDALLEVADLGGAAGKKHEVRGNILEMLKEQKDLAVVRKAR